MPKVSTKSLRSLASKVQPSILTGAINESADYIDELEKKNEELRKMLAKKEAEVKRLEMWHDNMQADYQLHADSLQRKSIKLNQAVEALEEIRDAGHAFALLARKTLQSIEG